MTLAADRARRVTGGLPGGLGDARRVAGAERSVRSLLLGAVMPLWLGAGAADWLLHRRTHIEDTAGPRESAVYVLMASPPCTP